MFIFRKLKTKKRITVKKTKPISIDQASHIGRISETLSIIQISSDVIEQIDSMLSDQG